MKKVLYILFAGLLISTSSFAQLMSREDSLNAGLNPSVKSVILSGYGEAKYSWDQNDQTGTANLTRNILFVGYKFNEKFTFFSETEIEDAKVENGGGEIALEQCVIKYNMDRNSYLLAGLFIPRIGIMN